MVRQSLHTILRTSCDIYLTMPCGACYLHCYKLHLLLNNHVKENLIHPLVYHRKLEVDLTQEMSSQLQSQFTQVQAVTHLLLPRFCHGLVLHPLSSTKSSMNTCVKVNNTRKV